MLGRRVLSIQLLSEVASVSDSTLNLQVEIGFGAYDGC